MTTPFPAGFGETGGRRRPLPAVDARRGGPAVGLPTREEIAALPPRCLAAFAYRCALRVEPLFRLADPKRHARWARGMQAVEQWMVHSLGATVGVQAAGSAVEAAIAALPGVEESAAIRTAAHAAWAALTASQESSESRADAVDAAYVAAMRCAEAAAGLPVDAPSLFHRDIGELEALALASSDPDPSVDMNSLGPLWGE